MDRSELFFDLPQELIAQEPVTPRDHCRLMLVQKQTGAIQHKQFFSLVDVLRPTDILVFNQSKVLPARLFGKKATGGTIEVVLLKDEGEGIWQCLIGGKIVDGQRLVFTADLEGKIKRASSATETHRIHFNLQGHALLDAINKVGSMPTPPYVTNTLQDPALYQTVYAKDLGSAAAPTAGLHFTKSLLDQIREKGVRTVFVTLHVGLGTFQPVKSEQVENHHMHTEWFSVQKSDWRLLKQAKANHQRVIAVGTTSVRVLETLANPQYAKQLEENETTIFGETAIFILPGYPFQVVDGLITNFHTPYSSLLALVYAFGGQTSMQTAYKQAIKHQYRFFSFGDAMFIHP